MTMSDRARAYLARHPRMRAQARRARRRAIAARDRLGLLPPRTFVLRSPDPDEGLVDVHVSISSLLYVGKVLEQHGLAGYEPESLSCFLAIADVIDDGPVWDIGCNVGVYSLITATASVRDVIAFEPTPAIARAAASIVASNGLRGEVRQTALGAAPGTARLHLSESTDSSNSLSSSFRRSSRAIDVAVETIDGLVAAGRTPPALLKIDTETTEPAVLRGGLRTIAEHRPWIMCEVLPGRTERQLMAVLEPLGYEYLLVTDDPPFATTTQLRGDPRFYMWVFAPGPVPDSLWRRLAARREQLRACGPV